MYGLYTLHFEDTNGQNKVVQQSNHLTRKGLKLLLKGEPKITHPGLVGARYNAFKTNLNFMFFYIKGESTELMVKDEDIFDMEFPDLNAPNIRWTDTGTESPSAAYSFEGKTQITIEGIGIGYKEIGGTGENDFVFSYTNLKNDPTNYQTNYFKNTDYNNIQYYAWKLKAQYNFRWASDKLPTIKANIGGQTYKFRSESYDTVNQYGDDSRQSAELFYQEVGNTCNPANAATRLTTFEWAVGGRSLVPASKFEELVIQDATTRELSRVFKVEYMNKRSFPVHITGFRLFIGDIAFSYKSEIDNYILLPAGKTISLTLAAEIFLGSFPAVDTATFNTSDYLDMGESYFRLNDTQIVAYSYTTYPGTTKEKTVVRTGIVPNEVYYLDFTGPTDQLTKYEFTNANGTKSKPYYVLGETTPSSYAFSAPALTSIDGWVVLEDEVVFRITAPTGVTHIEFSLSDNVWHRFEVVAGAANFIKLPPRFLYESLRYIRWANSTQTGIITRHVAKYMSDANILPIEYVYGDAGDPYIVGYYARTEANLPVGYTNASAYVEGTTALTQLKGGTTGWGVEEGAITFNNWSYVSNSKFVGPIPNSKWFDSVNMKLVSVPKFDEVVSTSLHNLTTPGNLVQTYYQITPVKVNTLVNMKLNAYPKITKANFVKAPTVEKPTTITGYLSPAANRIELYDTITSEIISSVDSKPCNEFTLNVTVPMYTHIPYGLRYIDALGQNISAGQEYFVYGKTLAAPDLPTDVYYDSDTNMLTFTAPARAVRATVSRYGIEMYSFECTEGSPATLFSSESFDRNGNYILTLLNSEGGKSEPYYIFGVQDDNPIKPDTTGAYHFNDWNYSSSNYTTSGNIPFMRVEDFEAGIINVSFDNMVAKVVGKTYNSAGILTSAIFETAGIMMEWSTGYGESDTILGKPSYSSYVSMLTGGYIQVVVWHEWLLYANVNLDKFGYYSYGRWVPGFGKNTNWYQFTEIQDGYIRNSVKLLMRTNSNSSSRLPFHLDSSIDFKTPNALIYIHSNDMPNSSLYKNDANNQSYRYGMFYPYINNVQGEWEVTYRPDGFTIDKLRCYTDEAAFVFDTSKADEGWKLEGFDPLLVGHPDYENVSYGLEFATYSKYSYTSFIGTDKYSNYVSNTSGTAVRAKSGYYLDQIYTRIYPYMYLKSFQEHTGSPIEKYSFSFLGEDRHNSNARWSEAAFDTNIGNLLTNTTVIINGQLATITPREVTIPYTPGKRDLLSVYQFEKPVNSGWSENGPYEAEQTPFTYIAYDFSILGLTLSNDKHPNVLGITLDGRLNNKEAVKVTFVRNRIIQPNFPVDYYSCTKNIELNNSIYQYSPYQYYYANVVLYPEYPRVIKNVTDTGTWDVDPSYVNVTQLSSLFMLKTVIHEGVSNQAFDLPEDLTYRNMVMINGEAFDLIINSNWIDWLFAEDVTMDHGDITFKLSNADASKEIQFKGKTRVDYVGFEAEQDIEVLFANYGEGADDDILSAIYDIYSNADNYFPQGNSTDANPSPMFIGYNTSVIYNYIPHVIPSGKQGLTISLRTKLYSPTVTNPEFVIPDRTEEVIERFETKYQTEAQLGLSNDYLLTIIDPTTIDPETFDIGALLQENVIFECNGQVADRITMDLEYGGIVIQFDQLGISIVLSGSYMYFIDTVENSPLERDDMFVFKFTTKNLPLNSNLSPFYFSNYQYSDAPTYGVQYSNFAIYNDIDGELRHQTFYIVTGLKPAPIVPIDNRISQSVYPAFGKDSYIYAAANQRGNNNT